MLAGDAAEGERAMSNELVVERNLMIPMSDGVELAGDVVRPGGGQRVPAILNYGPYHKDGRGGRLDVDATNRHFAARGYAALSVDFRGLGSSGGVNAECFAPQEGRDGHEIVEWIARQPWCDGNVGMWGVSYPGITALSTAATRPPHLKAIVPIHATSDLHRGVVGLGGCAPGFWMRGDWGPRMAAYNLTPPLLQDPAGRWARIWAEHLQGNPPWLTAFVDHPGFDAFWRARVADVARIECPTFLICGWRDLYADCTPRDWAAIKAPKKLLMGPWKHEFPDKGRESPYPGLAEMERWFDRWLKGERNGIDTEPAVTLHVQGAAGAWRAQSDLPLAGETQADVFLARDGTLAGAAGAGGGTSDYVYDPTVGMESLVWDPWTTSLDPALPRDQSGDDARALCFTGESLRAPLEIVGAPMATLEVVASDLPLNVVVKLAEVAPNGRSTLITTGWADLTGRGRPGERLRIDVALRATAYRLSPGSRLRVAVACADFPRIWPTPKPATLRLFHGASHVRLPVTATPSTARPAWGRLQPEAMASGADMGGSQRWNITRDLMSDAVVLDAAKSERLRLDADTTIAQDHVYGAAVAAKRPDLARMHATTKVQVERATSRVELVARSVTTTHQLAIEIDIAVDGQPFWKNSWRRGFAD
jgi:uncharacterized protein